MSYLRSLHAKLLETMEQCDPSGRRRVFDNIHTCAHCHPNDTITCYRDAIETVTTTGCGDSQLFGYRPSRRRQH